MIVVPSIVFGISIAALCVVIVKRSIEFDKTKDEVKQLKKEVEELKKKNGYSI